MVKLFFGKFSAIIFLIIFSTINRLNYVYCSLFSHVSIQFVFVQKIISLINLDNTSLRFVTSTFERVRESSREYVECRCKDKLQEWTEH